MVPSLKPYDGVAEILEWLRQQEIKTAIVTSSPRSYCSRVIAQWGWKVDATICYHDTTLRKPHPQPILKVLQELSVPPQNAVAIGDAPADIISAKAAGVFAIAARWGAIDRAALIAEDPDHVCDSLVDLSNYLKSRELREV